MRDCWRWQRATAAARVNVYSRIIMLLDGRVVRVQSRSYLVDTARGLMTAVGVLIVTLSIVQLFRAFRLM